MDYTEELTWVIRIEASAAFPDDYQGEMDGYAWRERFEALQPRLLGALVRELGLHPEWRAHPANRGRPASDEITIELAYVEPEPSA